MAQALGGSTGAVEILATDVDTNVLNVASEGVYPLDRLQPVPEALLKKYFLKGTGQRAGLARVREELRDMITFRQLNLCEESWNVKGPFDAIFCRNVMIYFDKPTQYDVISRLCPLLKRDGLFFAGHSESFFHATDLIRSIGRTVYQRADGGRA